jgi:hypothetical protein
MKIMKWVVGIPLALFGLLVVAAMFGYGSDYDTKLNAQGYSRAGIAECWAQYERKSLGEAEKRFIAGACEKMEGR